MMTFLKITGLTTILLVPTALMAAETALDADGDGAVTMTEFNEAMPDSGASVFAEIDADANGVLDAAEVAEAINVGLLPATSSEG
ncbi:MAG: EF-hand domain-containing protein [Pseudomonadota bacterium]